MEDINKNCLYYKKTSLKQIKIISFSLFKFILDRLFASIIFVLLSPVFLLISIIIKIDSRGPILHKQVRTGRYGKEFYVYKFRSMVADNDVRDSKVEDKLTRVGKFLRRTSLDEIPQLFSIAIGKMSFIGPRPWIPDYYKNMNKEQRHRCDVRPGLTGLAQVMGRNNISIFEKINYDLEYIKNFSLLQDIKIIFLTIKTVFTGVGVDAGKSVIHKEINDLKRQKNRGK